MAKREAEIANLRRQLPEVGPSTVVMNETAAAETKPVRRQDKFLMAGRWDALLAAYSSASSLLNFKENTSALHCSKHGAAGRRQAAQFPATIDFERCEMDL